MCGMAEEVSNFSKETTKAIEDCEDSNTETVPKEDDDSSKTKAKEHSFSLNNDDEKQCKSVQDLPERFIYEPTSGLYYDKAMGYYYNAEYGLYYDTNSGCYYSYNQSENKFVFHCKAQIIEASIKKTNSACDEDRDEVEEQHTCDEETDKNEKEEIEEGEISNNLEDLDSSFETENKSQDTASFIKEIREAAESVQISNGFLYEPKSGLFYDKRTGYYYNAECGLYYDGDTGSYYKMNQVTNQLELYCQGQIPKQNHKEKIDKYPQKRKLHEKNRNDDNFDDDYVKEDGEITTSSSDDDDDDDNGGGGVTDNEGQNDGNNSGSGSEYEDISELYPPSLRLIVKETNSTKLRIGTYFIITYKGGTLGREGNEHDAVIPDSNVSKYHLKFIYNETEKNYQCTDLGSRNGTLINGKRMSSAKQESEPFIIVHGDVIQISQTKLLCHIHSGRRTCDECEPCFVMMKDDISSKVVPTLKKDHKEQLKLLKRRYGLNTITTDKNSSKNSNYKDRAEIRRNEVGSSHGSEKTEMASTEIEISDANKGYQILEKMGWKKGESLTKNEPIDPRGNLGTVGFGYHLNNVEVHAMSVKNSKHNKKWKKAQERYEDLFEISSEEITHEYVEMQPSLTETKISKGAKESKLLKKMSWTKGETLNENKSVDPKGNLDSLETIRKEIDSINKCEKTQKQSSES